MTKLVTKNDLEKLDLLSTNAIVEININDLDSTVIARLMDLPLEIYKSDPIGSFLAFLHYLLDNNKISLAKITNSGSNELLISLIGQVNDKEFAFIGWLVNQTILIFDIKEDFVVKNKVELDYLPDPFIDIEISNDNRSLERLFNNIDSRKELEILSKDRLNLLLMQGRMITVIDDDFADNLREIGLENLLFQEHNPDD